MRGSRGIPRSVEAAFAAAGLVALAPVMVGCALAVRLSSPGSVLFRQTRVGKDLRPFEMLKFRSMYVDRSGNGFTAGGDPRVTPVGRLLRKYKLDELPELLNVMRGDMSLVGPRPEVPRYVDFASPLWREVLSVRPGLTDETTLQLRNEEELLAGVSGDRERFYREVLLPYKLRTQAAYLAKRNGWTDVGVLWKTAASVVMPRRHRGVRLDEIVGTG